MRARYSTFAALAVTLMLAAPAVAQQTAPLREPDVIFVPDSRTDGGSIVALGMDRAVLRVDDGPAAFSFHAANRRLRVWIVGAEPGAVRRLVEAILHRLRPDAERLEEHVVLRVTGHLPASVLSAVGWHEA